MALEVGRVAAADAGAGARLRADPGVRRRPLPVRRRAGRRRAGGRAGRGERVAMEASAPPTPAHRARAARVAAPRDLGRRTAAVRRRSRSSSPRSCSRTSTCARSTSTTTGRSDPFTRRRGSGIAIMALFVVGAVIYRLAAQAARGRRARRRGSIAVVFTLAAVALQFFEYTTLDFGAASGGYAAVFFGWTATYAIVALFGIYWIEIAGRQPVARAAAEGRARDRECPPTRTSCSGPGSRRPPSTGRTSSAIGVLAFIVLYLV